MKDLLSNLANRFGYKISRSNATDSLIDKDSVFLKIYEQCRPYTMTTRKRCFALYKAVNYIIDAKIAGDFVECGVWRGGNTMLIALALKARGVTDRRIYLYDTFAGMSEPTEHDTKTGRTNDDTLQSWQQQQTGEHNTWCYAGLAEVEANMSKTDYPPNNIHYIEGKVEDTLTTIAPRQISLLRLDTDWYESTKVELEILYPKLVVDGVLIIDEYGTWTGARKAVDEYFKASPLLLNKIDNTGHIATKPYSHAQSF